MREIQDKRVWSLWILGASVYVFFLVGHIPVSNVCYYLRDTYSEAVYRHYIQLSGILILLASLTAIVRQLRRTTKPLLKTGLWLCLLGVPAYYYQSLVLFDIEYVHFIQYCCLTMILYYASRERYLWALPICLLLGFSDEVYQAYHPPGPLNWRDILLNVLGVTLGALVLWTFEVKPSD